MGGSFRGAFSNADKGKFDDSQHQADHTFSFCHFLFPFAHWNIFFPPLAKNIFRVRFQDPSQGQSHTLQVNDVFHKQQWLNCLRTAMSTQKDSPLSESESLCTPASTDVKTKRRSSSVSAIIHMEEMDENCPRAAASAPSSPSSEEPPSPTPSATSTLSSSSSSSSISAPFLPRKSKKDKRSICSLGKRKETMV